MKNLTMYMITHKKIEYIPKDRTPLLVGSGENTGNYLRDNIEDNISQLNPYYCELTGLYWIWKNDKTSKYVSIEHYRRFFFSNPINPIKYNKLLKKVNKYDVLTTIKYKHKVSNEEYYKEGHYAKDLDVVYTVIDEIYPEYVNDYNRFMSDNKAAMLNMVCCRKDIFDSYCEWLFNILFRVEKLIDYKSRDKYQQRVFGFLAERLFNVWLYHNYPNFKTLGVYLLKENKLKSIIYTIKDNYF